MDINIVERNFFTLFDVEKSLKAYTHSPLKISKYTKKKELFSAKKIGNKGHIFFGLFVTTQPKVQHNRPKSFL